MKSGLKAVVDTNVIVSAVIGKSATFVKIYNAFVDNLFTPILSPGLQEEIFNVVKKPRIKKYFRAEEIKRFQALIKIDTLLVVPTRKVSLCRDTKDNMLLEAAAEAGADFIVTGDEDLLILKSCSGIPIVTAKDFIDRLKR